MKLLYSDEEVKSLVFLMAMAHADLSSGKNASAICKGAQEAFVTFINRHDLKDEFLKLCEAADAR